MDGFVKRRGRPDPGSIPEALQMFLCEVRFYREIAPEVGVRVPGCYRAEHDENGSLLVLEDLSSWQPGADPVAAARLLWSMHRRWEGLAAARWDWLRPTGAATDLVGELYDRTWPAVAARPDCTPMVQRLGDHLVGRADAIAQESAAAGPLTLVHGDASLRNLRTGPTGEIALLDWEDVGAAPGVGDLAWLLVSSVRPERWDEVVAGYGSSSGLLQALPDAAVQALLSFADTAPGSAEAEGWVDRIETASGRLA